MVKVFGTLIFGAIVIFWRYCKNKILVLWFRHYGPARVLILVYLTTEIIFRFPLLIAKLHTQSHIFNISLKHLLVIQCKNGNLHHS